MSTNSTQHQHQQVHSINPKKRLLNKNQGLPQVHSISTNSTQHQHQQVHSINPKKRLLKEKPRVATSPQHEYQQYTASAPTSTQHQSQKEIVTTKTRVATSQQHGYQQYTASTPQKRHSINPNTNVKKQTKGCHRSTA